LVKKLKKTCRLTTVLILLLFLINLLPINLIPTTKALIITPGTYFSQVNTNFTVTVPIDFVVVTIAPMYCTFNALSFYIRQIPTTSKVNISIASIIVDPLVAVSGNLIVDYYRITAAIPITCWYNITGLKPLYVYRYRIDAVVTDYFVTSNITGGIAFSSILTGTHEYKIYDYGAGADITPPELVINYAGNLSDFGGPYFRPPGETVPLNGAWGNGYFINDSYQYDDRIYINVTATDAGGVATVWLCWWNVTLNTWNNLSGFTQRNTNFWDKTYTTGIGGGAKYSFNVYAEDPTGNYKIVFWNKTGSLGSEVRRYVRLGCVPVNLSYKPLYLYSTTYPSGDYSVKDRLNKDHGTKNAPGPVGGINDLGYMKKLIPTGTVNKVNNSVSVGFWYGEDSCNFLMWCYSLYRHIWYNSSAPTNTVFFTNTTSYVPTSDALNSSTISRATSKSKSSIDYNFGGTSTNFYLDTGIKNTTCSKYYTDNNIYELFFGEIGNIKIINNISFTSFLIWNVPGNATLNASYPDSDADGLSDWYELYRSYTNPFLMDTDDDGQTDSYEILMGSDPNDYLDFYIAPAPGLNLTNPHNFHANWTTSSSIYLSWIKGDNALTTVIIRKDGSYPTSLIDGSLVYNGAGTFFNDTAKSPYYRWFYRAYSLNVTYSSGVNVTLAETDNTTVTTSSSASFKGYMATDKSIWTHFHYSTVPTFATTSVNISMTGEYYTETPTNYEVLNVDYKRGQSFTIGSVGPNISYYMYNVSIKAYRVGGLSTVVCQLYAAAGNVTGSGIPSGAVLSYGSKDVSGLTLLTTGEMVNITMSPYRLHIGTKYVLVFTTIAGGANQFNILLDTAPNYAGGNILESYSGGSYTNHTGDYIFKLYGHRPYIYTSATMTSNITIPTTSSFSIPQSDLISGQLYYYFAEGNDSKNNMTKGNTRYTLTNPDLPIYLNIVPYFTNNSIKLTWLKGNGANRTLVVLGNGGYADTISAGTILYNDTGVTGWFHNISYNFSHYYTLFSYSTWAGLSRYSGSVHIPWGGVTFIVYNLSRPWQRIAANITVTDSLRLHPIQFTNVYGYYSFNISQIPYGENTLFYVSNNSYHSQLYPLDILQNIFYNFSFYLAPIVSPSTGPPGSNVTGSYMVQIKNDYQVPVPGALVKFYMFLNTTANFTYIGGFVSDGNGQGSIDLFPYYLYMIKITCDGYDDSLSNFWTPNVVEQGLIKVFEIYHSITPEPSIFDNLIVSIEPSQTTFDDSFTAYFNVTCSDGLLEWMTATMSLYNTTTGDWLCLFSENITTTLGNSIDFFVPNITGSYRFSCSFGKIGFGNYTTDVFYSVFWAAGANNSLDDMVTHIAGRSPIYVPGLSGETIASWSALIAAFVSIFVLFGFSPKFSGLAIMSTGAILGFCKSPLGIIPNPVLSWVACGMVIILGLLVIMADKKEGEQ
jgi:hypothetical protein